MSKYIIFDNYFKSRFNPYFVRDKYTDYTLFTGFLKVNPESVERFDKIMRSDNVKKNNVKWKIYK